MAKAKTFENKTFGNLLAGVVAALLLMSGPVHAAGASVQNAAYATTGKLTSIPVGASDFCKRRPDECAPNAQVVDAVTLTEANWAQLLSVNTYFNQTIVPVTDEDLYQVAEYWTYPNGYGDCEDYALAKRRQLIEDGWPASTLLMTVVRQPNGEGHAVLMVRTDRGDLILDNKVGLVNVWSDTPYHFLKRQSQQSPGQWVDISDDRPTVIAAR